MSPTRKQRDTDRSDRLHEAEEAAQTLEIRGRRVDRQLSLVQRLSEGWRRVHQRNHLAQIFHEQGGL